MHPQYVAPQSSSKSAVVAAESQAEMTNSVSYLLHRLRVSFPHGYTQVAYPQKAGDVRRFAGRLSVKYRDRRLTCLRASKAFLLFPCLPSWRLVDPTTPVTSKNSWSLTRFQSLLSRPTQVSSKNTNAGQAVTPVPHHAAPDFGGCA